MLLEFGIKSIKVPVTMYSSSRQQRISDRDVFLPLQLFTFVRISVQPPLKAATKQKSDDWLGLARAGSGWLRTGECQSGYWFAPTTAGSRCICQKYISKHR